MGLVAPEGLYFFYKIDRHTNGRTGTTRNAACYDCRVIFLVRLNTSFVCRHRGTKIKRTSLSHRIGLSKSSSSAIRRTSQCKLVSR